MHETHPTGPAGLPQGPHTVQAKQTHIKMLQKQIADLSWISQLYKQQKNAWILECVAANYLGWYASNKCCTSISTGLKAGDPSQLFTWKGRCEILLYSKVRITDTSHLTQHKKHLILQNHQAVGTVTFSHSWNLPTHYWLRCKTQMESEGRGGMKIQKEWECRAEQGNTKWRNITVWDLLQKDAWWEIKHVWI